MTKQINFKFRKHDNIGAADADDDNYLLDCFVDTGDLEILLDCEAPQSIVVGRTGSGKTALLKMLKNKAQRVVVIPPESLSLSYISNSTILRFVESLGVKLDIFYRLLWRHIFAVELTKKHFNIRSEEDKKCFWQKIWERFKDQKNRRALEYLDQWGKTFWQETEYRIQEVTTKLEDKLETQIKTVIPKGIFGGQIEAGKALTEEQKGEIVSRAQKIVNDVQIRQLSDIISLLDEILDDRQKQYYILIDRLDEDWIEDKLRYRLIRALIETIRDFRKIRNAKIVISLRQDLLERVLKLIRGNGFQEEKYESMYLRVSWTNKELLKIMNVRLNHLIQSKYTKQKVNVEGLLPRSIDKKKPSDYIIDRTLGQPRDVIHFINKCIIKVIDKKKFTMEAIKTAEGEYSRDRLKYLADEWHSDYPNLQEFSKILHKQNFRLPIRNLNKSCEEFCLDFACNNLDIRNFETNNSYLKEMAISVANGNLDVEAFRNSFVHVFYKVGIVGIKLESHDSFIWYSGNRKSISSTEIHENAKVEIHPAFWRVFGIINKQC